jgi:Ca2+-transporting ATPase
VVKDLRPLAPDTPLADRTNMVYAGTHVTAGRALALVVATGGATEIGRIAALAAHTAEPRTPLERRVEGFGRAVVAVAAVLFVAVLAVGLARGLPFTAVLMVAVSQVVGVIPEGLPVAMTIALAVGVHRMARRRAIVRRMGAVETLGSTTVICTDKTGTLTRNEMTATAVVLPGGRRLAVTGAGLEPTGAFLAAGEPVEPGDVPGLVELLEAGALCNDATLVGPDASAPVWRAMGDPTEAALVTLAVKGGVMPAALREARPRRAEIPFDPSERLMATQHDGPCGAFVVVKGAPEAVLRLCATRRLGDAEGPLDDVARTEEAEHALALAADALRVLAIGVVPGGEVDGRAGLAAFEGRVTLLGFVGQLDPPRPEARTAVALCRAAGVRAVMVTGDHRATALAIARDLGLATTADTCVDGAELERMDDATLAARVARVAVFARVHPAQKLRIVQALRGRGEVVAMTGDGVNDAPALVSADVGVAMGRGGTEVAKESSDLVLADDDFATLVAAVEEGRVVRGNIGKAVLLLVSTSAAEVTVLLLALAVGLPLPFVAVQILWNNLVTEGLVTIHLVMEPAEGDEMGRPPRPADEPLVDRTVLARMAVMVPVMVAVTLGWFAARLAAGVPEAQARTETFTLLALCEWFNVLNCRSATRSALDRGLLRNRWLAVGLLTGNLLQAAVVFWAPLGRWFHTVPIEPREVLVLGVLASAVLWAEEGRKLLVRRRAVRAA